MLRKVVNFFVVLVLSGPLLLGYERSEFRQLHMATLFRIVLYGPPDANVQDPVRLAFKRIEELERILSSYREDSEVRAVSRRAFQSPQIVSLDLFAVLESSLELSRLTGGAFDITVRPFVELWQKASTANRLPDPKLLSWAANRVGYSNLLLNARTRSVRFQIPSIQVDFGGVGKGYAADEALVVLQNHGIEHALVYAGGDIRLGAPPPGRKGWQIELGQDSGDGQELLLSDCAIAGSGDAYQFTEIEGVRYSHIIDPRTGLGVVGQRGTTVIAPKASVADALATALTVLGPEKGFEIIRNWDGVSAQFVSHTNGKKKILQTAGFPLQDRQISQEDREHRLPCVTGSSRVHGRAE
jgi:thiamine biosynthesis lipoprotein